MFPDSFLSHAVDAPPYRELEVAPRPRSRDGDDVVGAIAVADLHDAILDGSGSVTGSDAGPGAPFKYIGTFGRVILNNDLT